MSAPKINIFIKLLIILKEFVNKEDKTIHTNTIENVWRNVRRYFKVYNGVRKNFNLFLQEVIFRINYTCYNNQSKLLNIWSKAW